MFYYYHTFEFDVVSLNWLRTQGFHAFTIYTIRFDSVSLLSRNKQVAKNLTALSRLLEKRSHSFTFSRLGIQTTVSSFIRVLQVSVILITQKQNSISFNI